MGNDAYRYVDWLLTVPMLLIEIILVMGLSAEETKSRCTTLGLSAALMIAFGYPGEVTGEVAPRMLFWFISMIPFCYIVSDLISKCGVGFLVYRIALAKSKVAQQDDPCGMEGVKLTDVEASNM